MIYPLCPYKQGSLGHQYEWVVVSMLLRGSVWGRGDLSLEIWRWQYQGEREVCIYSTGVRSVWLLLGTMFSRFSWLSFSVLSSIFFWLLTLTGSTSWQTIGMHFCLWGQALPNGETTWYQPLHQSTSLSINQCIYQPLHQSTIASTIVSTSRVFAIYLNLLG